MVISSNHSSISTVVKPGVTHIDGKTWRWAPWLRFIIYNTH